MKKLHSFHVLMCKLYQCRYSGVGRMKLMHNADTMNSALKSGLKQEIHAQFAEPQQLQLENSQTRLHNHRHHQRHGGHGKFSVISGEVVAIHLQLLHQATITVPTIITIIIVIVITAIRGMLDHHGLVLGPLIMTILDRIQI